MMNGIRGRLPWPDAIAMAVMLVRTGRAVPPGDWIDGSARDADDVMAVFGAF